MIVRAGDGGVELAEPGNCTGFHVEVAGSTGESVGPTLEAAGAGRLADDGEHAHILIEWVRAAAAGRVGPTWDADFEGMLGYARGKGWIDGETIVAHIEGAPS